VGDDFPLTKGFAQEGAGEKMSLSLAIVAVTVSASAGTPLVLGYIASSAALIIGVVNLLVFGFVGFVDRVVGTDFRHCENPFRSSIVRPLKQLFTFRRFPYDPQGVLTAVNRLALVSVKRCLDFCLSFWLRQFGRLELRIATFADTDSWNWRFYDPAVCASA
jgi:hypothetical protein